jgi:[ribosomal protein S5]-alanine N-acetyltransferase
MLDHRKYVESYDINQLSYMFTEDDIILRRLTNEDRSSLARLVNNKKIWDNVRDYLPFPYTENDAASFISLTIQETIPMTFAIEYQGQFCGVIGITAQSDVYKKTAEIGYWIGEPFWKKGIATIAVKLITNYGLQTLDYIRIHTGVFEYNVGSMRVLEKNGYTKDGVFKKAVFKNGKIWDEHRFSITQ